MYLDIEKSKKESDAENFRVIYIYINILRDGEI